MRVPDTRRLIWAVAILSVAEVLIFEGWHARLIRQVPAVVAYCGYVLNLAISVCGFFTPQRWWWLVYAVASLIIMFLISAATPVAGLWQFGRVAMMLF